MGKYIFDDFYYPACTDQHPTAKQINVCKLHSMDVNYIYIQNYQYWRSVCKKLKVV